MLASPSSVQYSSSLCCIEPYLDGSDFEEAADRCEILDYFIARRFDRQAILQPNVFGDRPARQVILVATCQVQRRSLKMKNSLIGCSM